MKNPKAKYLPTQKVWVLSSKKAVEATVFDYVLFSDGKVFYYLQLPEEPRPNLRLSDSNKISIENLYPESELFPTKNQLIKSL